MKNVENVEEIVFIIIYNDTYFKGFLIIIIIKVLKFKLKNFLKIIFEMS